MEIRSADVSNKILVERLGALAEEGKIPQETVPVIKKSCG